MHFNIINNNIIIIIIIIKSFLFLLESGIKFSSLVANLHFNIPNGVPTGNGFDGSFKAITLPELNNFLSTCGWVYVKKMKKCDE